MIIGSGNYDLYLYDDYIKYGRLTKRVAENAGGHCMTVTGITDDGNFIVSSWGGKYVLDIDIIKK